jgi:MFS family permease
MGLLQSAPGVGSLVGSLVLTALGDIKHKGRLIILGACCYAVGVAIFAMSPWFGMALPILFFVGAADVMVGASRNTIMQLMVRRDMLGRVMSVNAMTTRGTGPLGGFQAGALAELVGIRAAIAAGAGICLLATVIVAVAVPQLRSFTGTGDQPDDRARGSRGRSADGPDPGRTAVESGPAPSRVG